LIRLNKYISSSGFCSRREADKLIELGRVYVNGHQCKTGQQIDDDDFVEVNGQAIKPKTKKEQVYLAFNKPEGITCTTQENIKGNIVSYINYDEKIFPIGRLDKFSQGLIFMTNDGDIVNKILRAGNAHEKEYIVGVDRPVTDEFVRKMSKGVPILDTVTHKCKVSKLSKTTFKIILTQGLNRQIRRMCEYLGYHVTGLQRTRIMNVELGRLKPGGWRRLNPVEMEQINKMIESSSKTQEASKDQNKGQQRRIKSQRKKEYSRPDNSGRGKKPSKSQNTKGKGKPTRARKRR
jgi:23S rRNA pseudouridine2604 synthase